MLVDTTSVPPRGWNSYDSYGVYINEEQAVSNIRAFVEKLAPAGYEYFVLDACWYMDGTFMDTYRLHKEGLERRSHIDLYGRFIESPELFPHSLRYLADMCHNAGIKFGVHLMRGIPALALERNSPVKGMEHIHMRDIADFKTPCAWPAPYMGAGVDMAKEGAQEYYDSVVEYLADIVQVDFIKFDDAQEHIREVKALADAVRKVDRKILISLSPGQETRRANWPELVKYANMVRITCDIWDGDYAHVNEKFDRWEMFEALSTPACRIDLDMIPIGGIQVHVPPDTPAECQPVLKCRRKAELTEPQKRTLMTQLALANSPLFYGGDLPMSDESDIEYVTNQDMLDCNSNGEGGICIYRWAHCDIRLSFRAGSQSHGWIGIFNRSAMLDLEFTLTPEMAGFAEFPDTLFDIWEKKDLVSENGVIKLAIPKGGCTFVKF